MHFLLTNDDGVDAPGLAALESAVREFPGVQVTVVAPKSEQSQCGHRVTTATPLVTEQRGERRFAVEGTPADCVRVALVGLALDVDWVLSGINQGGNLGQDIVISGTVAAAREATYHGVKAMSFSHYVKRGRPLNWTRAASWVGGLITERVRAPVQEGWFWNFNLPHLEAEATERPAVVSALPARGPLPVAFVRSPEEGAEHRTEYLYAGSYADRPRDPGSDVDVCFGGKISMSEIAI